MQTPQGYRITDGRFFPVDWMAIIFNPSFPYRLAHTVTAFYITTAFVVLGVGAYLLRAGRSSGEARVMIRMALDLLIVLVPVQMLLGDQHGLNTLEYQPAKLAAIEGRYDTERPTPLTLFRIPDDDAATMRAAVEIPDLGSLILTHSWNGEIKGFTVAPLGFVAVLAGWTTTEVGRQPWTVYGLLRTADSVSPSLTGTDVAISLALYVTVYLIMFPTGIALMAGLVRRGVQDAEPSVIESGRPHEPIESAARIAA